LGYDHFSNKRVPPPLYSHSNVLSFKNTKKHHNKPNLEQFRHQSKTQSKQSSFPKKSLLLNLQPIKSTILWRKSQRMKKRLLSKNKRLLDNEIKNQIKQHKDKLKFHYGFTADPDKTTHQNFHNILTSHHTQDHHQQPNTHPP